jgi:hypothetical protein
MWPRRLDPDEHPAENAVLEAVTNVIVRHLRIDASQTADPILIQVDGPGRTQFLKKLEKKLDPPRFASDGGNEANEPAAIDKLDKTQAQADERHDKFDLVRTVDAGARLFEGEAKPSWTAISFDAWRYQRVAPPWWWLMSELDKQLKARRWQTDKRAWARQRSEDLLERLLRLAKDLLWVMPGVAIFLIGLYLHQEAMVKVLGWLVTAGGGIAAILALLSSIRNALRRHLLAQSPRGATALLRNTDPMADLLRRYAFLVRSARSPIIVLIDNLDRCRAEYVVEMLEGIQTILRHPHAHEPMSRQSQPCPLIAFVVAADRRWLCDSYLHAYKDFEHSAREPGRPFGLMFVDKVFDIMLRIPTVPAAAAQRTSEGHKSTPSETPFRGLTSESCVRAALREEERALQPEGQYQSRIPAPVPQLRIYAVEQLAEIEIAGEPRQRRQCRVTARHLDELLAALDPGTAVQRQLDVAYCVKRTTLLLAGHEVDDDHDAIYRLGLWTILQLKWPLLAEHLTRHPTDIQHLGHDTAPERIDEDLKLVFTHPVARRIANGFRVRLTANDIVKFTNPLEPRGLAFAEPLSPEAVAS